MPQEDFEKERIYSDFCGIVSLCMMYLCGSEKPKLALWLYMSNLRLGLPLLSLNFSSFKHIFCFKVEMYTTKKKEVEMLVRPFSLEKCFHGYFHDIS